MTCSFLKNQFSIEFSSSEMRKRQTKAFCHYNKKKIHLNFFQVISISEKLEKKKTARKAEKSDSILLFF